MENSNATGEYESLLQSSQSPQRHDFMLGRHSSSTENMLNRHQTGEPRPDITCTPYTPASATTSANPSATTTLLSGSSSGSVGVGAGACGGSYPGYLSGGYYPTNSTPQGYLSPSVSLLYPHLYPQQGQLALIDPRAQGNSEQFVGVGSGMPAGSYGGRDLENNTTSPNTHQMMGPHMGAEEGLHNHVHERFMSNGNRVGAPSPNDPSVWRPY